MCIRDRVCGERAGRLVMEALGYIRGGDRGVLLTWWDAICLYDDVIGTMESVSYTHLAVALAFIFTSFTVREEQYLVKESTNKH